MFEWLSFLRAPDDGGGAAPPPADTGGTLAPVTGASFEEFDRQWSLLDADYKSQGDGKTPDTGGTPPLAGSPLADGTPPLAGTTPTAPLPEPKLDLPEATPPAGADKIAQLEARLAQQQAEISSLRNPQGSQAPQPQQGGQRLYNHQVSPEAIAALNSDDPNQQRAALSAIMNDQATIVHQRLAQETVQYLNQTVIPAIFQSFQRQQESRQQSDSISSDFYGTHRDLAHPAYKPTVLYVTERIAQHQVANGTWRGYTPEFRDLVATQARAVLSAGASRSAPTFTPSGARPSGVQPNGKAPDDNSPEGIAAALGL